MSTKIVSAEVFVCSPGRNFVTLRITTEGGVYGLGDGTLNGRELAVEAYLKHHIAPTLIGRDAHDIEDIWQYLYRGSYWRRGHVNMTAIAAVDMALWDIKGVTVYCHAFGKTTEALIKNVQERVDQGFTAVRIQTSVPGLKDTYGVPRTGSKVYEPADSVLPHEDTWNTSKYMRHIPTVFQALRDAFGEDLNLLHDVHHRLTPNEAAHLGKILEPFNLFWLEDATPAENQESFRHIRKHTTIPLALGEVFNSIHDSRSILQEQLVDYIRTNLHAGGISHVRRLANLADLYQIRTGFHGATDLSPVTMGCALHFDLSISNFGIQEYMEQSPETEKVFPHAWFYQDGMLHPGESIGHGVQFNEELAKKYPYKPKALPVNRLEDGSMWDY